MTTIYAIVICLHANCWLWNSRGPPEFWQYPSLEACEARRTRVLTPRPYEMHCASLETPAWQIRR